MNFLILDTTQKNSLAIAQINNLKVQTSTQFDKKPSEHFLPSVQELLEKNSAQVNDIDIFCAVTGPGSFTGIRVGLSTLKGITFGKQNAKIITSNVFEVLSKHVVNGIILLVSTSTSCYYGKIKNSKLNEYGVIKNSEIETIILENEKVFVLEHEQQSIGFSYNNIETINNYSDLLFNHFNEKVSKKQYNKSGNFEPFYIQLSQAERELNAKENK